MPDSDTPPPAAVSRRPAMPTAFVTAVGMFALVGGAASFAGWAADVRRLADWSNNGISIQPNATIALTLAGAALALLALGYRRLVAALGVLVALLGGGALPPDVSGRHFEGLHTLLLFRRD